MTLFDGMRVVDLTHRLTPGQEKFKLEVHTYFVDELLPGFYRPEGEWYILQEWEMSSHVGTHVESPYHHIKDGGDVSQLGIDRLMGEAVVLDFHQKEAGEAITLREMEEAGSVVRGGDIVLIYTGFDTRYGQANYNRPYLTFEAIRWLADREACCIGIDASGIEKYKGEEQPGHLLLFGRGIPIIEELTHLDQLRRQRVFFVGLPLPIKGADSCPIRAVAIEEE